MKLFRRMVYALYIASFFIFFTLFIGLLNVHSIDEILTPFGIIWLFITVVGEIYFTNL